jgi:catechol 2,3-dioxygenase-like lactoylglutathione lyase family enzyme
MILRVFFFALAMRGRTKFSLDHKSGDSASQRTAGGRRDHRICNHLGLCYSRFMSRIAGLKGMRHIALKVSDTARSKRFYQEIFGLDVVWEPDPENVYLSSGSDNIAIHQVTEEKSRTAAEKQLDHLGFVVESIARVKELEAEFRARNVAIVHPFKIHRDGSASFYCADPDGIVIQLLYEPTLSRQTIA